MGQHCRSSLKGMVLDEIHCDMTIAGKSEVLDEDTLRRCQHTMIPNVLI